MKNSELMARRTRAVPRGVSSATSRFADQAENALVWDEDGARYVDFAGGIAVLNVGHRHPGVLAAVEEQMRKFTHTAFQVMPYASYVELAERLNAIAPISGDAKTILFTTGAEATENAVKIARTATGRTGIISFAGGFHGRTLLSSAMTGKVLPYKRGQGPFPPDVYHVPYPSESTGISVSDTLRALDFLFSADIEPERVAAFIIEPVQGEGGFHAAPDELYQAIDKLRRDYGILLIADEIQSGFGRTGKMFGIEHASVKPDLITMAKSLSGGFPLSAVCGRAEVMDAVEPGGLGGTYGGSPVGCAAALAVLKIFEEEGLVARANVIGDAIKARIAEIAGRNDTVRIANLRGLGAMIAFDLHDDKGNPDGALAKSVCSNALREGLILLSCGRFGQTIRILVPLTVQDEILKEGLDALERALLIATN